MKLHHSEWLDQAKAVPVGQKRRVYHGAERTAAMDVYNNPDSWTCYCHRCHGTGYMRKQFIEKVQEDVPVLRRYLDRRQLVSLTELHEKHLERFKRLVVLLHTKGVSLPVIDALEPMYNISDDRLVFQFYGVNIGRDCTDRSPMKWMIYHHDSPLGWVYLQGSKDLIHERELVVLCEDLFSAQKIRHYTGVSTLCLLGTKFPNELAGELLNKYVVCCTDGDDAGDKARRMIYNRCQLFGIPVTHADVPRGYDPKDLKPAELSKLIVGSDFGGLYASSTR